MKANYLPMLLKILSVNVLFLCCTALDLRAGDCGEVAPKGDFDGIKSLRRLVIILGTIKSPSPIPTECLHALGQDELNRKFEALERTSPDLFRELEYKAARDPEFTAHFKEEEKEFFQKEVRRFNAQAQERLSPALCSPHPLDQQ